MQQLILIYWIDLRNVLIAASGAQSIVDARGVPVTDGSHYGVTEPVCQGGIESLHVGGAFKKIGVQQIGIQRVLLNVLVVETRLPDVPFQGRAIDLSQLVPVAEGEAKLIRFVLISGQLHLKT